MPEPLTVMILSSTVSARGAQLLAAVMNAPGAVHGLLIEAPGRGTTGNCVDDKRERRIAQGVAGDGFGEVFAGKRPSARAFNLQGAGTTSGPLAAIGSIALDYAGYAIVALFIAAWLIALAVWRFGRIEEKWSARLAPGPGTAE